MKILKYFKIDNIFQRFYLFSLQLPQQLGCFRPTYVMHHRPGISRYAGVRITVIKSLFEAIFSRDRKEHDENVSDHMGKLQKAYETKIHVKIYILCIITK